MNSKMLFLLIEESLVMFHERDLAVDQITNSLLQVSIISQNVLQNQTAGKKCHKALLLFILIFIDLILIFNNDK